MAHVWVGVTDPERKIPVDETCTYCGDMADAMDHIIPRVITTLCAGNAFDLQVPACTSCNSHAGYQLFDSISAKRRYIQKQIARKHKKILATPDWTEEELKDMSWQMQTMIRAMMEEKSHIKRRIAYTAERSSDPVVIGSGIALRNAVKNIRQKINEI